MDRIQLLEEEIRELRRQNHRLHQENAELRRQITLHLNGEAGMPLGVEDAAPAGGES